MPNLQPILTPPQQQLYILSMKGPRFVLHLGPEVIHNTTIQLEPANLINITGIIAGDVGRSLHIIVHSIHLYSNFQAPHSYNLRPHSS
ncbi:hypothetical protein PtB15_10B65 [Puccinia triticina]|nr:hypothetical protein PtB15_10B65 [Puccinia triticina]